MKDQRLNILKKKLVDHFSTEAYRSLTAEELTREIEKHLTENASIHISVCGKKNYAKSLLKRRPWKVITYEDPQ